MDSTAVRERIGTALRLARDTESVHSTGASGLGYRVVDRLERGANDGVDLSAVYLLALHYRVNLGAVLRVDRPVLHRDGLGSWPADAPSLPDTDAYLRNAFRDRRLAVGCGTPKLAMRAGVHQPWVVRFELGSVARCDLVRVARCCEVLECSLIDLLPVQFLTPRTKTKTNGGRRERRERREEGNGADPTGR